VRGVSAVTRRRRPVAVARARRCAGPAAAECERRSRARLTRHLVVAAVRVLAGVVPGGSSLRWIACPPGRGGSCCCIGGELHRLRLCIDSAGAHAGVCVCQRARSVAAVRRLRPEQQEARTDGAGRRRCEKPAAAAPPVDAPAAPSPTIGGSVACGASEGNGDASRVYVTSSMRALSSSSILPSCGVFQAFFQASVLAVGAISS
jgi:hypothetical protein